MTVEWPGCRALSVGRPAWVRLSAGCTAGSYASSAITHVSDSTTNMINNTNAALLGLHAAQEQSKADGVTRRVDLLTTDRSNTPGVGNDPLRLAHRHMIALLQQYTQMSALYAGTTGGELVGVRNRGGVFKADIVSTAVANCGGASGLETFAVTLSTTTGATAAATAIDYTTAESFDCATTTATVLNTLWYTTGSSAGLSNNPTWTGLYWNFDNEASVAATIGATTTASGAGEPAQHIGRSRLGGAAFAGVLAAELASATLKTALDTASGTQLSATALIDGNGVVISTGPTLCSPSTTQQVYKHRWLVLNQLPGHTQLAHRLQQPAADWRVHIGSLWSLYSRLESTGGHGRPSCSVISQNQMLSSMCSR